MAIATSDKVTESIRKADALFIHLNSQGQTGKMNSTRAMDQLHQFVQPATRGLVGYA